jgi:uncharacterized protein
MNENKGFYLVAIVLAIALIIFGVSSFTEKPVNVNGNFDLNPSGEGSQTISVQGNAAEKVTPDEAYIYFTIKTIADNSENAQNENTEIWNSIKEKLDNENYLKYNTESYNIWPKNEWNRETEKYDLKGYEVSHRIKITLTDIEKAGTILDLLVNNGVNDISNVSFGLSEDLEKETKAKLWEKAVKDAKERAKIVVQATGSDLIETPKKITLNNYSAPAYRYDYALTSMDEKAGAAPEIEAEEINVSVSLDIVYGYE